MLKDALIHAPILKIVDPKLPFDVYTNAFIDAIGAVLLQDSQLIAYESKKLINAEKNYPLHTLDIFAIVHTLNLYAIVHALKT